MAARWIWPVWLVAFVALAVGCRGESEQSRYLEAIPETADVQFVDISSYPAVFKVPLPLTPSEDAGRIEWLLQQLRDGRLRSESTEHIALHSDFPAFVVFSGGREAIRVFPAWDCRRDVCSVSPRYVGVTLGSDKFRVHAPDLSDWLRNDWLADTRNGSPEERAAVLAPFFALPQNVARAEDVTVLVLGQGGPAPTEHPIPLRATDRHDAKTIAKVIGWLHQAVPIESSAESTHRSRAVTVYAGRTGGFHISTASTCTRTANSTTCAIVPDEVVMFGWNPFGDPPEPIHFRSPALAQWLHSGWQEDFRMGTLAEYEAAVRE